MNPLVIRSDANPAIGSGHVMRCLALAEAWQDAGGDAFFVLASPSLSLEQRLLSEGMHIRHLTSLPGSLEDAEETLRISREMSAEWIVADGYHLGAEYQKRIKDSGFSLLVVDDYGHAGYYYADIVLNQNSYADMSLYPHHEPETRFMLGTGYSLMRREFLQYTGMKRVITDTARKILVTFGGTDPENITLTVINLLKQVEIENLELTIVSGSMNPHIEALQNSVDNFPSLSIRKDVSNMPELMAWADFAIAAGGSTCWELAYMGVPAILHPLAANQIPNVVDLTSKGIVKCLPDQQILDSENNRNAVTHLLRSKKERTSLHRKMKNMVDGHGSHRLVFVMGDKKSFMLRAADQSDCAQIWRWANDPIVRSSSFHSDHISWSTHKRWYASKTRDPNCFIFIMESSNGIKTGQIRFDITDGEAQVGISIDPLLRGWGLGSRIIRAGVEKFHEMTGIPRIHAYIKTNNISSLRSFENAGFTIAGSLNISGHAAYHLLWEKS
jgi:UDP-2,4-diacetamido-2,4,6-trideoxy-beta-L-altropyranose hydrolase